MNVQLLAHTPAPEQLVAASAKLCYSAASIADLAAIEADKAAEFIEKNGRPLYLGEYGAIANCDDDSAVRWYNDVADLCLEYGIGRAVWSYRGFAKITDAQNEVHDIRMVEAIVRK